MNYTEEQTKYLVEVYEKNPNRETVDLLAIELEKSAKSIIGKLSREGVYRREVYRTKTGENPISKAEIVQSLSELLSIDPNSLVGLEKAPKGVLKQLEDALGSIVRHGQE
jgi:hypothetical protein